MNHTFKNVIYSILLCSPTICYGTIAYIPQTLKHCMAIVDSIIPMNYTQSMQDLYSIISENRIVSSETIMRQAIQNTLAQLKKDKNSFKDSNQRTEIKKYLKGYLRSLRHKHVLLVPYSDTAQAMSWPSSSLMRSLKNSTNSFDIIQLSNELKSSKNITLCGDINDRNKIQTTDKKRDKNPADPDVIFNANMMTNILSTTPTIVFGTGVASPIINAWIMTPSTITQYPVNIEFGIPSDLQKKKPISLELHFLVKQQPSPTGKARIQVNAKYMHQSSTFDILSATPSFTHTDFSDDFTVSEPSSTDTVKHISVKIPLKNSSIKHGDLAFLSLTRVAPESGTEYNNDIYLAAATFHYTSN